MYYKRSIGQQGEICAQRYLLNNGFKILEKNFRCKIGEIDIIGFDVQKKEIVFIEVKTRSNIKYGFPVEAVDIKKQKHIINTAKIYLIMKKIKNITIRFDVIEVYISKNRDYKINHIKYAFTDLNK